MTTHIDCLTFDCADPARLADFWAQALNYTIRERQDDWVVLRPGEGHGPLLGFQRVPEPKVVKNRVHLDLLAAESMEAEVARLESLGATIDRVVTDNPGDLHTILRDPEGNEFCVVQP